MLTVSVESNVKEQLARLESGRRDLEEKAIVRALNRTADNVRAEATRRIRETYTLKASTVRNQMSIGRAWGGKLEASVSANGRPIPLYEFDASWKPQWSGARFKVKKGKRQTLPHTFIATMKSGKVGVFERKGPGRLPIEQKFSIGMPGMFGAKQVQQVLEQVAFDSFDKNFSQQIKYLFPER